jgi:hypothetical protein
MFYTIKFVKNYLSGEEISIYDLTIDFEEVKNELFK